MNKLEEFYFEQYKARLANQIKREQKIIEMTNELVDNVPKIIERMIQEAETSHPDCTMIKMAGEIRPSWAILHNSDDISKVDINLLLNGRLVYVHQNLSTWLNEPDTFDSYAIFKHIYEYISVETQAHCLYFYKVYDLIVKKALVFGVPSNEIIGWQHTMSDLVKLLNH